MKWRKDGEEEERERTGREKIKQITWETNEVQSILVESFCFVTKNL